MRGLSDRVDNLLLQAKARLLRMQRGLTLRFLGFNLGFKLGFNPEAVSALERLFLMPFHGR